jgi:hypothetical protein
MRFDGIVMPALVAGGNDAAVVERTAAVPGGDEAAGR